MQKLLILSGFIFLPFGVFCQGLNQHYLSFGLNSGCSYLRPKGSNTENWKYRTLPQGGLDAVIHHKWTRNREFITGAGILYYGYNFKSQSDVYHDAFIYLNVQLSIRKYANHGFYKQLGGGCRWLLIQGFGGVDETYKNFSGNIGQKHFITPFLSPQIGVIRKSRNGGQMLWDIAIFYQIGLTRIGTVLLEKNTSVTQFISRGSYLGLAVQRYLITNKKNFNRGNDSLNKTPYPNKPTCPRRS